MSDGPLRVAGGFATTRDAEHAEPGGGPFVATSFSAGEVVAVAAERAADLPEQARLFVFPGHETLTGTTTVGELLASTAIDDVVHLDGAAAAPDDRVDTQSFVRPTIESGRVVLLIRPAAHGYIPFEQPNPTPCCAEH